jgi:hypothetical protein
LYWKKQSYPRKYESEFKKALARESGVFLDEKTKGRKSCDTVPLNIGREKSIKNCSSGKIM